MPYGEQSYGRTDSIGPDCYTAEDFCTDHPYGTYVLAFGGHVATVKDGVLYDAWNSSHEIPQYYFYRKGDE